MQQDEHLWADMLMAYEMALHQGIISGWYYRGHAEADGILLLALGPAAWKAGRHAARLWPDLTPAALNKDVFTRLARHGCPVWILCDASMAGMIHAAERLRDRLAALDLAAALIVAETMETIRLPSQAPNGCRLILRGGGREYLIEQLLSLMLTITGLGNGTGAAGISAAIVHSWVGAAPARLWPLPPHIATMARPAEIVPILAQQLNEERIWPGTIVSCSLLMPGEVPSETRLACHVALDSFRSKRQPCELIVLPPAVRPLGRQIWVRAELADTRPMAIG